MDSIFDSISQDLPINSILIARAALLTRGHVENYLKIESYIISKGYEKRISELKIVYVKTIKK